LCRVITPVILAIPAKVIEDAKGVTDLDFMDRRRTQDVAGMEWLIALQLRDEIRGAVRHSIPAEAVADS